MKKFDECRKSPNLDESTCRFECNELNSLKSGCWCFFSDSKGQKRWIDSEFPEQIHEFPEMKTQESTVFQKCLNQTLNKGDMIHCTIKANHKTKPRSATSECRFYYFDGPNSESKPIEVVDDSLRQYFSEEPTDFHATGVSREINENNKTTQNSMNTSTVTSPAATTVYLTTKNVTKSQSEQNISLLPKNNQNTPSNIDKEPQDYYIPEIISFTFIVFIFAIVIAKLFCMKKRRRNVSMRYSTLIGTASE